jgi:hypothetical protein
MPTPEELQASINQINAELAAMRQARGTGYLAGFPKWVVVLFAVWVVAIETADKLPQIMLSYPRYEAALAEAKAKIMQPDLVAAQLAKAQNDATTSSFQPQIADAQLKRAVNEAKASNFQPELTEAQLKKTFNEAAASEIQPETAVLQRDKLKNDVATSAFQPDLTKLQTVKAAFDAQASVYQPQINQTQLAKLGVETKTAAFQQGITASESVKKQQDAAFDQGAAKLIYPLVASFLGNLGVNLPLDKLVPNLAIIDPNARTADLESALPQNAGKPLGPRPSAVPFVNSLAPKSGDNTDTLAALTAALSSPSPQVSYQQGRDDHVKWNQDMRRVDSQFWGKSLQDRGLQARIDNNPDYARGWRSVGNPQY